MDFLYGAGAAVLVIVVIEGVRYWRFCKKLDRRFELHVKMSDWQRATRLRLAGVNEASIAELQARITDARADADKGVLL